MMADGLTKAFTAKKHHDFVKLLGLDNVGDRLKERKLVEIRQEEIFDLQMARFEM